MLNTSVSHISINQFLVLGRRRYFRCLSHYLLIFALKMWVPSSLRSNLSWTFSIGWRRTRYSAHRLRRNKRVAVWIKAGYTRWWGCVLSSRHPWAPRNRWKDGRLFWNRRHSAWCGAVGVRGGYHDSRRAHSRKMHGSSQSIRKRKFSGFWSNFGSHRSFL